MTCMKACFDQESCMSNHSPQDTNSQTTAVALTTGLRLSTAKVTQMENEDFGL